MALSRWFAPCAQSMLCSLMMKKKHEIEQQKCLIKQPDPGVWLTNSPKSKALDQFFYSQNQRESKYREKDIPKPISICLQCSLSSFHASHWLKLCFYWKLYSRIGATNNTTRKHTVNPDDGVARAFCVKGWSSSKNRAHFHAVILMLRKLHCIEKKFNWWTDSELYYSSLVAHKLLSM